MPRSLDAARSRPHSRRRRLLRAALAGAVLLAGLALAAVAALWPPELGVPAPGAVLHHVTVVNPGEAPLRGRSVVVRGDRIERIVPTPPDAPTGPFAGAVVVPGLVDLHVHHPPPFALGERRLFALLFLAHGVTSVRDTGGAWPESLRGHARAIREGRLAGPRVFSCGPFLDGDPPSWPGARVVHDAAEARVAVDELVAAGYDCAKIYNELDAGAVDGILAAARDVGLPVVAHVPFRVPLVRLREVEVQHLMGLREDWHAVPDASLDAYVRTSVDRALRHTPTLVTFVRATRILEAGHWAADPIGRLLPRYHREVLWNPARNPLAREQATDPERPETMKRAVARLHAAGVPVLAGTDTLNPFVVPGHALHEELGHLVEAGLAPAEAWAAASWRAGEALAVPGLGRITEGAPADLLLLDADPTRDLAALAGLRAVVAAGRLYERAALDAARARLLEHLEGTPYAPLSSGLAALGVRWLSGGATGTSSGGDG